MRSVEVGRVVALWRYPVKSMAGERLAAVDVSWRGLAGDRRWAFVRDGLARSGFPWLTIRERPDMCHYRPSFRDPGWPDASATTVRTPAGDDFDVVDAALAAELGAGVRVMKQQRGVFDTMPLSLITTQSVAGLGALLDDELDVRRFRPNLLIEAAGEAAFPEDAWVGCVLRIGDMRMRVDKRDQRCVVVNVDPVTTQRDPPSCARSPATARPVSASTARPSSLVSWRSATGSTSRMQAPPAPRSRAIRTAACDHVARWHRSCRSSSARP